MKAREMRLEKLTDFLASDAEHEIDDELVAAYQVSGSQYAVVRENRAMPAALERLTDRERQVVALLAVGRTPKEIAYALGISHSTTRVLLGRARTRVGARTCEELIGIVKRQPRAGAP